MDKIKGPQKVKQDDTKTHIFLKEEKIYTFELFEKPLNLKIVTESKIWPLKLKVTTIKGRFQLFISFEDPFPDD